MKITTSIQLTQLQIKELKRKSEETGNSLSSIVRQAIEDHLNIQHEEGVS